MTVVSMTPCVASASGPSRSSSGPAPSRASRCCIAWLNRNRRLAKDFEQTITKMPGLVADYPDMVEPAYILFEGEGSGEFVFGCCTGEIWEASSADLTSINFSWSGCDEMDQVEGDGFAELQPDGSLHGEIEYRHGDEFTFIARKWTSSTAC